MPHSTKAKAKKSERAPAVAAGPGPRVTPAAAPAPETGPYTIPDLIHDIHGFLDAHLSPFGLIEGIGRKLRRALRNPRLLTAEQMSDNPERYARHEIHHDPQDRFVVMCLVWRPGQGTPVHDHGTWGVMGVYRHELEAVNYKRIDDGSDEGYADLRETGSLVLGPGSLSWVLPPNEEIHVNRNTGEETCVTVHVYGKRITGYHMFNVAEKSVRWRDLLAPP